MALTAEQKELNRQKRNERDRAWRARYKARDVLEKQGLAAIEEQFAPAIAAADALADAAEKRCRDGIAARRAEIDRLEQELKDFTTTARAEWHAAREPVQDLYSQKRAAESKLEKDLDSKFPDLVGAARWSAAMWKAQATSR